MDPKQVGKGIARLVLHVLWPWPAIRKSVQQLNTQKQQHTKNIRYIKQLARGEKRGAKAEPLPQHSFDEMLRNRPANSPSIGDLEKRFLRQKRLALGTGAAFVTMAGYAIAKGNMLGIATLLSCLPLFFMASLSAQLRLWQLRKRRLSKEERGGLKDFMREIDGWYWEVLDPEIGNRQGEE